MKKKKNNNRIKIKGVLANAEPNFNYPDPNIALSTRKDDSQDKRENKDKERINQYQVLLTKLAACAGKLAKSIYLYPKQIDYLKSILERQIPIRMNYAIPSLKKICPSCGDKFFIENLPNFCPYCGQAFEWYY